MYRVWCGDRRVSSHFFAVTRIVVLNYRIEIDGLRAFAVIPVILFHAGLELFSGGFVGVDVFFVISGYLITTIIVADIENNRFSFAHFYERRARRILPVLYVVVLVSLAVSSVLLLPQELLSAARSAISIPFFASNFFFWSERGYFGTAAELKPFIHTWSLAVEEQFYIVFPIVLLFLSRLNKHLSAALLFIAFVLSLTASFYVTKLHFDTAFYFPFTRAWELLIGAFCALVLYKRDHLLSENKSECISLIGLGMIVWSYVSFDSDTLFPYLWALVPTIGTALFILTAANTRYVKQIIGWQHLVFIGVISYSLYLWHQPLFAFARTLDLFEGKEFLFTMIALALSYLSYRFIESPFRDRSCISTRMIWTLAFLVTLAIIVFGSLLIMGKGLPGRYAKGDQELLLQLATYKGYNNARFVALESEPFDKDASKKILLVGDSHARDFLNVVVESGLFANYSFSTRQINHDCGNLYLQDYTPIQSFIPLARKERCELIGRYNGDAFNSLVVQSDEVWLVSSWSDWVVDLLPLSIANLERDFAKPVKVIGRKNFGYMGQQTALSIAPDKRVTYTQPVAQVPSDVADALDRALKNYKYYYPVMDDMCGGDRRKCQLFTRNGLLISADGNHLTREGAIEIGTRIRSTLLELRDSPMDGGE